MPGKLGDVTAASFSSLSIWLSQFYFYLNTSKCIFAKFIAIYEGKFLSKGHFVIKNKQT